jgi:hypothetical protein
LAAQHSIEITSDGVVDGRPAAQALENELDATIEAYTNAFKFFILNANLIARLEAREYGIANALGQQKFDPDSSRNNTCEFLNSSIILQTQSSANEEFVHNPWLGSIRSNTQTGTLSSSPLLNQHPNESAALRLARIDQQLRNAAQKPSDQRSNYSTTSSAQNTNPNATPNSLNTSTNSTRSGPITQHQFGAHRRLPRLFGGSLEEYCQLTGQKIPIVVTSCINALAKYAVNQKGVFRVNGAQSAINKYKEAFEAGEDPLQNLCNVNDVNCIASLLKTYLRNLREPLFPFIIFERLIECAKTPRVEEFIAKVTTID